MAKKLINTDIKLGIGTLLNEALNVDIPIVTVANEDFLKSTGLFKANDADSIRIYIVYAWQSDWVAQFMIRFTPNESVFFRTYNGTNKSWTAWKSIT